MKNGCARGLRIIRAAIMKQDALKRVEVMREKLRDFSSFGSCLFLYGVLVRL